MEEQVDEIRRQAGLSESQTSAQAQTQPQSQSPPPASSPAASQNLAVESEDSEMPEQMEVAGSSHSRPVDIDQSQSAESSPPPPLSFAAVVGGGSGSAASAAVVGSDAPNFGVFNPMESLREPSSIFCTLSQSEVQFSAGECELSIENQTLLDSFVGKPYSKWSHAALKLLTKEQFRALILEGVGVSSVADRSHIKLTMKLEEKVKGQLLQLMKGERNLLVSFLCRAAAGGGEVKFLAARQGLFLYEPATAASKGAFTLHFTDSCGEHTKAFHALLLPGPREVKVTVTNSEGRHVVALRVWRADSIERASFEMPALTCLPLDVMLAVEARLIDTATGQSVLNVQRSATDGMAKVTLFTRAYRRRSWITRRFRCRGSRW